MQRIDKWLWFSRALKTRSQAAAAVAEGRIRVNGVRIDAPAKSVKAGDVITAALTGRLLVWKVLADGDRRGPAEEARALYEDLSPGSPPRPDDDRPAPDPSSAHERPGKSEKKAIDRLLNRR